MSNVNFQGDVLVADGFSGTLQSTKQVLSGDGAIATASGNANFSGLVSITKGSAAALTLAAPPGDGLQLIIVSETAFAHVITATPGLQPGTVTTFTFSAIAGDTLILESRNGSWWMIARSFTALATAQVLSADGAISVANLSPNLANLISITKGSAAAITLAAPLIDDLELTIISESAFQHVITQASPGFNPGSVTTFTFSGVAGDTLYIMSRNGIWWIVGRSVSPGISPANSPTVLSGDGAITKPTGQYGIYAITKGTAAALTLAAPVAGAYPAGDDGKEMAIYSETAAAHVITSSVDGFNAKGSSGTATFGAAKGNAIFLVARNGHWWSEGVINVTIA